MCLLRRLIVTFFFSHLICAVAPSAALPGGYDPSLRPDAGGPPTRVSVALYLNDLYSLTEKDQTFGADVYVVVQWKDERLKGRVGRGIAVGLNDIWSPHLLLANQRDVKRMLPDTLSIAPDGRVEQRQRLLGKFSAPMSFSDFPRDDQLLFVRLVGTATSGDEVNLIPDPRVEKFRPHFSIAGWRLDSWRSAPEMFSMPNGAQNAGFTASLVAHRSPRYYLFQFVVPLIFIVAMSWSVFWLDVEIFPQRQGIAITSMLTIIAYRFALGEHLPEISYLTRFDYFLFGCTVLVLMVLGEVTIVYRWVMRGRISLASKTDLGWRVCFPIAVVLLTMLTLFR